MKCFEFGIGSLFVSNGLPNADILADSCLMQSYLGTYGRQSIFVPSEEWALQRSLGGTSKVPRDTTELAVVYQNAVEGELNRVDDTQFPWYWLDQRLEAAVSSMDRSYLAPSAFEYMRDDTVFRSLEEPDDQVPEEYKEADWEEAFKTNQMSQILLTDDTEVEPSIVALHRTLQVSVFAFRNLTSAAIKLDTLLDPSYKLGVIPYPPTPVLPVPSDDISRVRELLSSLKYDDRISKLVNTISVTSMREDITWLTGEAEESPIESRHSFHPDTLRAAAWIKAHIESTGANCEIRSFLVGFAPNVICRYPATKNTTSLVILSAHYDSRGSFGSTRAPGGDDDGSGTTSILAIARSIALSGVTFKSNVELCLFAGEEQGLRGSRAYASELRAANADITLMIQVDMLAYHAPGELAQLGLPDLIGTPEVGQLVANISALYSPELEVGLTPVCCSDHQSFHEQGFAATQLFERTGLIADPMYHNSGDLSERPGYDFQQLGSIAKVQFATLLHAAGYSLPV